jgi:hypothetical protein
VNEREYRTFRSEGAETPRINAGDFPGETRTLAYGYTADRDCWHLYVDNDTETLHLVIYRPELVGHPGRVISHDAGYSLSAEILRPNKRVYPDTVDLEFARKMRAAGFDLPFYGNFDFQSSDAWRRAEMGPLKGKTYEQLYY